MNAEETYTGRPMATEIDCENVEMENEHPFKILKLDAPEAEDLAMEEKKRQSRLYFEEHLGIPIDLDSISPMIFNVLIIKMVKLLPVIRKVVLERNKKLSPEDKLILKTEYDISEEEFLADYHKLTTKLCDKFDIVLNKVFSLPDNAVLQKDFIQVEFVKLQNILQHNNESQNVIHFVDNLKTENAKLSEQILDEQKRRIKLQAELYWLEKVQDRLEKFKELQPDILLEQCDSIDQMSHKFSEVQKENLALYFSINSNDD